MAVKKLGSGYYSVSRVAKRLKRAYERWERLKNLYNEVSTLVRDRDWGRKEALAQRLDIVRSLRDDHGWKFSQIGAKLGVTRQRAIQLYQQAEVRARPVGLPINGSSPRQKSGVSARRIAG